LFSPENLASCCKNKQLNVINAVLRLLADFWPQLATWKQFYINSLIPNVWVKLSKVHQHFQITAGKQGTTPAPSAQVILCSPSGSEEIISVQSCNGIKALSHPFSRTPLIWIH